MIQLKDKDGNVLAEVPEDLFPLRLPLTLRSGEREYFIKVFYEEDGTPRSAVMNTKR